MLDVLGLLRVWNGRNDSVEFDVDFATFTRVDRNQLWGAEQIPGRPVPFLPLSPVHRQLDRLPIGSVERFVFVQYRLNPILTGWDIGETLEGITEDPVVNRSGLSRPEPVDIDPKDLLSV
jgi:hypothetical protein